MCKAGYLGEKIGPPSRDPDDMRLLFEAVANGFDTAAAHSPGAIQWEFPDAETWHVHVDNGDTRVVRGTHDAPKVRIECRFEDWVDVVASRADPRRLVVRGRLRPRGDLRWLLRSRKMFPSG
jgi:hypothetical protein